MLTFCILVCDVGASFGCTDEQSSDHCSLIGEGGGVKKDRDTGQCGSASSGLQLPHCLHIAHSLLNR